MVLPLEAIEAIVDVPGVLEVKPGAKTVRLTYRVTLRNLGQRARVLHAPSAAHAHGWHLFDEQLREIARDAAAARAAGSEPRARSFRGVTLGAGQELHETRTIAIDAAALAGASSRCLLRVHFWGQSAEAEFHTLFRPVKLVPARKKATKKTAQKTAAERSGGRSRNTAAKKSAKRAGVRKKGPSRERVNRSSAGRKK